MYGGNFCFEKNYLHCKLFAFNRLLHLSLLNGFIKQEEHIFDFVHFLSGTNLSAAPLKIVPSRTTIRIF